MVFSYSSISTLGISHSLLFLENHNCINNFFALAGLRWSYSWKTKRQGKCIFNVKKVNDFMFIFLSKVPHRRSGFKCMCISLKLQIFLFLCVNVELFENQIKSMCARLLKNFPLPFHTWHTCQMFMWNKHEDYLTFVFTFNIISTQGHVYVHLLKWIFQLDFSDLVAIFS